MSAAMMMERIAEASPRLKAHMAGVFYLLTMLTALIEIVVHDRLSSAANLAAGLIEVSGMVAATLLLYDIFKPVSRGLSSLAAAFNLLGLSFEALLWCLSLLVASTSLVGLTFGALQLNPRNAGIGIASHGFYCIVIGYLIFRSAFLPRILGALMAFAGLGWLTFLSPPFANHLSPFNLAFGMLGEGSVMLWLLVMGVNVPRWKERGSGLAKPKIEAASAAVRVKRHFQTD
jgi:Domain of unknown function (DUF4386)